MVVPRLILPVFRGMAWRRLVWWCLAFCLANAAQADWTYAATPTAGQCLDVALGPSGALAGRAIWSAVEGQRLPAFGQRIVLLRQGRAVAETSADREGRFVIHHLPGGIYQLLAWTPQGPLSRCLRLWPAATAPPHAVGEIELLGGPTQSPLVRGQSPFPAATFGQVATATGIAAGAIAVPVIYSTKREPWIPASP